MNNKKLLISSLLAGCLTVAANGVQAGAVATSYLDISNMKMTDSQGNKLDLITDVLFILPTGVNNTGDTSANLNGVTVTHTDNQPADFDGLDIASSSVGAAYTENSFSYITGPDATSDYTHGDALLTGAIVNIFGSSPDTLAGNAHATTLAEVSLTGGDQVGSAAGNNVGVQGTVSFTATATTTINVSFHAEAYVRSLLSADVPGTNAAASTTWSMILRNIGTGEEQKFLEFDPQDVIAGKSFPGSIINPLNLSNSATTPGQDFLNTYSGNLSDSFAIVADQNYQLTVTHSSTANAKTVPEPTSLLLMSLSLFGLAWTKRFRNN